MPNPAPTCHALSLLSGGLDSLLAVKVLQEQGLSVLGLHFVSPFFGKPDQVERWRALYDIPIQVVPLGPAYVDMLRAGPRHGLGKVLNPCVDCKILMLRAAKALLPTYNASFIVSGEVLGQRPMSQRRDALNIISRDADVRDILLRPLSARFLPETPMERSGLVDRERLPAIKGRGRKDQLALAAHFGFTEIPTPAGGCRLAETESAKRYWPLFARMDPPVENDFHLANVGRQYWKEGLWLTVGRDKADNERLVALSRPGDMLLDLPDLPGPTALARPTATGIWDHDALREAAALTASFSPRARKAGSPVRVLCTRVGPARREERGQVSLRGRTGSGLCVVRPQDARMQDLTPDRTRMQDLTPGPADSFLVTPSKPHGWAEPTWDAAKADKRTLGADA